MSTATTTTTAPNDRLRSDEDDDLGTRSSKPVSRERGLSAVATSPRVLGHRQGSTWRGLLSHSQAKSTGTRYVVQPEHAMLVHQ